MRFLQLILICRIFSLYQGNEMATNNTQATVSHARRKERKFVKTTPWLMNFPSLFPRFKLRVWLCFNRAYRFRKMRGSRSGERDEKKKGGRLYRKHLIWTFLRWSDCALPKWVVSERNVRQEAAYMWSAFCLRHFKDPGCPETWAGEGVLRWSPDMNWIIAVYRSQHLLVASHKSSGG